MSFLQIDLSSIGKKNRVIGIDLGTTNSLVAYVDENNNQPYIIDINGDGIVPSIVALLDDKSIVVGREAKKYLITDSDKTIYSVKRLMGKSFIDIENNSEKLTYKISHRREGLVRVEIAGKEYTPIELSSMILLDLKKRAEEHFGEPVFSAVITVPAYFNDSQRQATKDAGKLAGLDVLRIINEPTAAALSYGLDKTKDGVIAVYDLGGGTFDISILKIESGVFQVLATNGNSYLGGDDLDNEITNYFIKQLSLKFNNFNPNSNQFQYIKSICEEAKKELSFKESIEIVFTIPDSNVVYKEKFNQKLLNILCGPIIEKTIKPCLNALYDSGYENELLDSVVLVGGSTRMPLVKKMVSDIFKVKVIDDINPDEVVALGAAVQADILSGNRKDTLLLDVIPLSLGIEAYGGVMSFIVSRNTPIPTQAQEVYTTQVDNQTGIKINVYQGEREFVKDNRELASFLLSPLPPLPAGMNKIEVSFVINADGILNVKAKDTRTGLVQEIDVTPSYGLTELEIERMLRESIERAHEDINQRILVEAKNEANSMLMATEKSMKLYSKIIYENESKEINDSLLNLKNSLETADNKLIRDLTDHLDRITENFAKRIMDDTINKSLKDKVISKI